MGGNPGGVSPVASRRPGRVTQVTLPGRTHLVRSFLPYLLALPIVVLEVAVIGYPVLQSIALSFTRSRLGGPPPTWVGLANYERLITDPQLGSVLLNTVGYMAGV